MNPTPARPVPWPLHLRGRFRLTTGVRRRTKTCGPTMTGRNGWVTRSICPGTECLLAGPEVAPPGGRSSQSWGLRSWLQLVHSS